MAGSERMQWSDALSDMIASHRAAAGGQPHATVGSVRRGIGQAAGDPSTGKHWRDLQLSNHNVEAIKLT